MALFATVIASAQVAPAAAEGSRPAAQPAPVPVVAAEGEPTVLSPFEVVSNSKGYYSTNTMSGTRFNTKLEDIGSSVSVMTKEQMADFSMLNINDVFLYTAGAEGAGTFTDFTVDRNGQMSDNVQLSPTTANRMRGISSANVSYGNYETMNRMPIDPIIIEGIEISRGPNANVFGLGNAAGTVNMVPAAANMTKNFAKVQQRFDSYDGYRSTIDINRVLLNNKLAFRINGGFDHEGFVRKPSGVNTVRYDGFVKYRPFKNTTITGGLLFYRMNGNRPNYTNPRDYTSDWIAAGKPTWDPVQQQVHVNGNTYRFTSDTATVGGYTLNQLGLSRAGTIQTRSNLYIDSTGVAYWQAPNATSTTLTSSYTVLSPAGTAQTIRLMQSSENLGTANASPGRLTNQPLWTTTPVVSSKAVYDWSSLNLSSVNRLMDRTIVYNGQIDQIVFDTQRQMLAVQAGAFREDSQRYMRTPIGNSGTSGQSGQLFVDVNEKNLDGSTNAFLGKTYIGVTEPLTKWAPAKWDTYRAQMAYQLDLRHEAGWLKYFGLQQFSAYDEYKYRINRQFAYREALTSTHAWTATGLTGFAAGTARGNQTTTGPALAGANVVRTYQRYYVGGNNDGHITVAPSTFDYGSYPFHWGGYTVSSNLPVAGSGKFSSDPASLDLVATTDSTGGSNNLKQVIKTPGMVVQSHFFDDKLVTTVGFREDKVYSKFGATPGLDSTNTQHNFQLDNSWAVGDYRYNSGKTKTFSAVARPFRDVKFLNQAVDTGTGVFRYLAEMARDVSFTYNRSDNFVPQAPAVDLFLKPLPNTTGEGRDKGLWLIMDDNKIAIRFNIWKTTQFNARNGDANTVAQRVLRKDIMYGTGTLDAWNLPTLISTTWNTQNLTGDALNAKIADITKIPTATAQALATAFQAGTLAATNDITAKGTELEINYNPTKNWTVAASATETESINTNISSAVQTWIDQRMPVWTSIIDPLTNTNWWTTPYGSGGTAYSNHLTFVQAPYAVIKQQEGKSLPSVRKYAGRVSTSLSLAAISDNKIIRNIKIGGAARWEDKGAIGYYGKNYAAMLATNQAITELDPNNPIYDKAHWYFDAFIGYSTKLWGDKIGANFQLNVRNLTENGRLQAIGAFPDGTPNNYRIVDPREFFLTASFDL